MSPGLGGPQAGNHFAGARGLWAACLLLAAVLAAYAQDGDHDEHGGEETGNAIRMPPGERASAGVVVEEVSVRRLSETVRLPGEVTTNAYRSAQVTTRIAAQVVARHARLGDPVENGQRLLTLSSVEMAEAQGGLIVADREWRRVRSLGRDAVSARRYNEAEVARQQAYGRVLAYGMTEAQAEALMQSGGPGMATGVFELTAPQAGTVLRDDFLVGELIEPGRTLFHISDESVMWVEAQTVLSELPEFNSGARARVSLDGVEWFEGIVIQRHHLLDESTRTQGFRIEVDNADDRLHPGQFVEVELAAGASAPVLAVPNAAVTLIGGASTVFRLEDGAEFHAEPIEAGAAVGGWTVVHGGLSEGDEVAVAGVFHLKSLLLKSSLGEGHAH